MFSFRFVTILTVISVVVSFMYGCRKDDAPTPVPIESIDVQLTNLLKGLSPDNDLSYFIFPESTDYSAIPQDPNNPLNSAKVELGKLLFHETRLGHNPMDASSLHTYSCASCHHVGAGFQAGLAQGMGEGGVGFGIAGETRHRNPAAAYSNDTYLDVQPLRSPSAMNMAYQTNILWNGQFGATGLNTGTESSWTAGTPKEFNYLGFEGLETQAIAGQNVHRLRVDTAWFQSNAVYNYLFNTAFSELPEEERISQITAGLAIAAYERTLLANQAPFQFYLQGDYTALTDNQKQGAILFFGKANCASCHTGPALNSMEFHGYGMENLLEGFYGVEVVNPNDAGHKGRGGFTNNPADDFKFKVPQLYNLTDAPFYGHGSSFTSVRDVIVYKNAAIAQKADVPSSQLASAFHPLGLTDAEIDAITDFIEKGLYDASLYRYVPSDLPSGMCFPNADVQSQIDMGCFQ